MWWITMVKNNKQKTWNDFKINLSRTRVINVLGSQWDSSKSGSIEFHSCLLKTNFNLSQLNCDLNCKCFVEVMIVCMLFFVHCRVLAEKLNLNYEEAERWIVNLIRTSKLDAKIDTKTGTVVMEPNHPNV